jgi:hypothetical protein
VRAAFAVLLVVVLAGCAGAASDKAAVSGGPAPPGELQGVVVDSAIRPVASVRVELDSGLANATSAADGLFRFMAVPAGAHLVRASKAGYSDTVAQVDVPAGAPAPVLRLVLVADLTTLAYAETQSIEGYVECGMYGASFRYATCGTGNVASLIACSTFHVCLGNVSEDRYIVVQRLDRTPDFLAVDVAWTATQDLGRELQVYIGAATPADLAAASTNDYNGTIGPSPLFVTMNKTMLDDSGIGKDAYFLAQTFSAPSLKPCSFGACGVGLVVQQRFTFFLTSFYGFQPAPEWRFVVDGAPPVPPSEG